MSDTDDTPGDVIDDSNNDEETGGSTPADVPTGTDDDENPDGDTPKEEEPID